MYIYVNFKFSGYSDNIIVATKTVIFYISIVYIGVSQRGAHAPLGDNLITKVPPSNHTKLIYKICIKFILNLNFSVLLFWNIAYWVLITISWWFLPKTNHLCFFDVRLYDIKGPFLTSTRVSRSEAAITLQKKNCLNHKYLAIYSTVLC